MDGRVYTLDDEIDVIQDDLAKANRQVESLLRAPRDGRMGDPIEWEDALVNARRRVMRLEAELREACAQQIAAAEMSDAT